MNLNPEQLHHAYVLEGHSDSIRPDLFTFFEKKLKHPTQGNPDFWHEQFETLSVDDARRLRELQSRTALREEGRKIFVIELLFATVEAQNALLKVFEEPTERTHFFLIMPSHEVLLPTVRSRVIVISHMGDGAVDTVIREAKDFLRLPIPERLAYVAQLIEEKEKRNVIGLVNGIIAVLAEKKERNHTALSQLLDMRGYLNDRSPSLKLILEHISLIS